MRIELPFRTKSGTGEPTMGNENQQFVDNLHGRYYQAAKEGRVYHSATTPLGLAIPIYTSVTPLGNVLWNPQGSGVNAVLISYNAARVSGVEAFGTVGLIYRKISQSNLATAAPFSAFAETTPVNGLMGGGVPSACKSSNAGTCTLTAASAAGDFIRNFFGMLPVIDTSAVESPVKEITFDGTLILPPGGVIYVAASVASVALFAQDWTWEEVPV